MAALADTIAQVQKYIRALDGIRAAPTNPPDSVNDYPFAICYAGSGEWQFGAAGDKKGLHNLVVEIHVNRSNLAEAVAKALPFGDSIPNLLMNKLLNDNKWNGTIDAFRSITYTFGPLSYGGAETVGWKFTITDVKIQSAIA